MNNQVIPIYFTLFFKNKNKLNVLFLIFKSDVALAQPKTHHIIFRKHRTIVAYTELLHSNHCNLSLVHFMTKIIIEFLQKLSFDKLTPTRYLSLLKTKYKPSEHVKDNSQLA